MNRIKDIYLTYEEIINYVIVGAFTTLVSLVSYYLCVLTVFNPNNPFLLQCANVISWIIAVTFAYWANRKFVFKSRNPSVLKEGLKFYSARLLTLIIDMLFMTITVSILNLNDKIMKLFSQIVILILNYILSKFLIFVGVKRDEKRK